MNQHDYAQRPLGNESPKTPKLANEEMPDFIVIEESKFLPLSDEKTQKKVDNPIEFSAQVDYYATTGQTDFNESNIHEHSNKNLKSLHLNLQVNSEKKS